MRLACKIHGCQLDGEDYYSPNCWRCGAELYDIDFVQIGLVNRMLDSRILRWFWLVWYYVNNRCGYCKKRLWMQQYGFCNKNCEDRWIPF